MVNDGTANSAAATVNIVVNPVNDAPTAVDDAATVAEDSSNNLITVLTNDSPDPDGDALTVSAAIARNGDVTVVANQLQYTPDADFSGTDTIHYVISDGNGGTSVATVTVTVTPGNDAPVVSSATVTTNEDSPLSGTLPAPTDADGTTPTFVANSITDGNGTFTVLADGTYTFMPAPNVNGTVSYTFDVTDGITPTTATLTIQINAVNDGPVANDFTYAPGATEGGAAVAISVAAEVSDVDAGDVPNVAAAIAEHGTVTFLGQTINYTPDSEFSGTDTISYIVTDGNGGSAVATITIAVASANDDPTVAGLTTSGVEDQVLTGQLPAPVDPDGDAVTFTPVAGAATANGGTVDITATGAFTYTPAPNYHGDDSFTFTVDDGNGGTATATVTLDIASVNDAPVAVDVATGTHATPDNTEITITIPAASDADGDPVSLVTAIAANGSIFVSGDDITYTPRPGFTGDDTITYLVSDGNGATDTATIIVSVTANNDAPVFPITTLSVATNEDNAVTSQVPAATDADGDALTYSVEAADVPADGTVAIDPNTGVFTYTPNADSNGTDTFTVTVTDGGGLTDTVVVSVNVAAENDAPSITGITGGTAVNEEASLVLTVASTDPEADAVAITSAAAQGGSVAISGNMITYTPAFELAAGATATDTITVIVSDGNGGFDASELTVTVTGVDDASILGDDQASTDEGVAVVLQASALLSNDSDVDDVLSLDTGVAPIVAGGAATGTAVYDVNGDIVFTPEANFNGQAEITYTTNTGSTATVFVDVAPQNDGPVITTPAAITTAEDTATNIVGLSVADADIGGDTLTVVLTASNGRINVNDGGGAATVTPDTQLVESVTVTGTLADVNTAIGNIGFVPNEDYDGPASVTVTASDGQTGGVAVATLAIDVTTVNDAPEIIPLSPVTLSEGGATVVAATNLFVDDVDDNSLTITFNVTAAPANGFLALVSAPATPITSFTGADIATQQVIYVHDGSETTTDVFQVTATDPGGAVSSAAPIAIAIDAVNDAPVATAPGPLTAAEGAAAGVIGTVTAIDSDPGDSALFEIVGGNESGLFSINGGTGDITLTGTGAGGAVDDADVGAYQLTVRVTDSVGEADEVAVSVTITDVNTAPTNTSGATATMQEDGTYFGLLSGTDADNDALTFTQIAPLPSNGTATVAPNGFIIYVPNADFNGTETINYEISDGNGGVTAGALTITVTPENDAPVVVAATQAATEDTAVTFDVVGNASDVDGDGLTVTGAAAGNGTVTIAGGNLTYTPNANYNGLDSIIYTVSDGNGGVTHGTISVTVGAVDDAAVAGADTGELLEDVANGGAGGDTLSVSGNLLANDSDVESGAATSVVSITADGTTTAISGRTEIDATGAAIVDPNSGLGALPDPLGTLVVFPDGTYHYQVDDSAVQSLGVDDSVTLHFEYLNDQGATGNIDITIRGTNDGPDAVADAATMDENATTSDTVSYPGGVADLGAPGDADNTFTIDVLANDTDPDRTDPVGTFTLSSPTVTAVTDLIAGTNFTSTVAELNLVPGLLTVNGSNQLVVTPGTEFDELDFGDSVELTIEYTVTDVSGASDVGVVTLTVTGTNDAPVIDVTAASDFDGTALEDTGAPADLSDTGTIVFTDVDLDDTHTPSAVLSTTTAPSVTGSGVIPAATSTALINALGVVLNQDTPTSDAGEIVWTFTLPNADAQFLAEGQTLTVVYDVTVEDTGSATDMAEVTIVVTGTNDAPTITSSTNSTPALNEQTDTTGDSATDLMADGVITFADVDLIDTHTASSTVTPVVLSGTTAGFVGPAASYFVIDPVSEAANSDTGTFDWHFDAPDSDFDYLGHDESLTLTYTVTVDDGQLGGTVDQTIAVTISGSNDRPTLTAVDVSGAVVEDGDTPDLTDTGTITLTDVDLTDAHSVDTIAPPAVSVTSGAITLADAPAAALVTALDGALTANVSTPTSGGTGEVTWNFTLANAAAQFLAADEEITVVYDITVSDDSGDANATSATQPVTVTITGANDAPEITVDVGDSNAEGLTEDAPLTASGTLSVEDVDFTDQVSAAKGSNATIMTGGTGDGPNTPSNADLNAMFSITSTNPVIGATATTGSIGWDFNAGATTFDYLAVGQTQTITYTVTATDDAGVPLSDSETVTITITGTNDVPTIDLDVSNGTAAGNDYAGTFTENGPAVAIVDVGDIDIDDLDQTAMITTATVTLTNAQVGDIVDFSGVAAGITGAYSGTATLDGANVVTAGGTVIVTLTADAAGGAPLADFEAALEALTFNNTAADDPNTTDRTITVTVTDDQAATSATATSTISVDLDLTQSVHVLDGATVVATFDTIQAAIDAIGDGGTTTGDTLAATANVIHVEPAGTTYAGGEVITIDVPVSIIGQGASNADVVIDQVIVNYEALDAVADAVSIENVTVSGGTGVGIDFRDNGGDPSEMTAADAAGTLSLDSVAVTGFSGAGLHTSAAMGLTGITVNITDSTFTGNGTSGANGQTDINLFNFAGNATLTDVTVTGGNTGVTTHAIQIAGFTGSSGAVGDILGGIGDVTFDNVTVSGEYQNTLVYINGYNDFSGVDFTAGLNLGDGTTTTATGWTGLYIEPQSAGGAFTPAANGLDLTGVVVDTSVLSMFGTNGGFWTGDGVVAIGSLGADSYTGSGSGDHIVGFTGGGTDQVIGAAGDDLVQLFNVLPDPDGAGPAHPTPSNVHDLEHWHCGHWLGRQ